MMLRDLAHLSNHRVRALDGDIGAVHDLLFDDQQWTVRYLVVDTRPWMPSRRVLISPVTAARVDWASHRLRVRLTRDQVKDGPGVDTDPPVSRQEEERLVAYYGWPAYWGVPDPEQPSTTEPEQREAVAAEVERSLKARREYDPHLRSLRELTGYDIAARDGPVGHLEGFLGDDVDWVIRYLVVASGDELSDKRVLLPPPWIRHVDWTRAEVAVDVLKNQIQQAPPYNADTPFDRTHEEHLHDFYDRRPYWNGEASEVDT
jgi:hypothetical protein